jgi:hypothetical protein
MGRGAAAPGIEPDAGGGGSTKLVIDDAGYPPAALSASLPGEIQLSELPDPWNVHEALATPDAADGRMSWTEK